MSTSQTTTTQKKVKITATTLWSFGETNTLWSSEPTLISTLWFLTTHSNFCGHDGPSRSLTHHSEPLGTHHHLLIVGGEKQLPRGWFDFKRLASCFKSTGSWTKHTEREETSKRSDLELELIPYWITSVFGNLKSSQVKDMQCVLQDLLTSANKYYFLLYLKSKSS